MDGGKLQGQITFEYFILLMGWFVKIAYREI